MPGIGFDRTTPKHIHLDFFIPCHRLTQMIVLDFCVCWLSIKCRWFLPSVSWDDVKFSTGNYWWSYCLTVDWIQMTIIICILILPYVSILIFGRTHLRVGSWFILLSFILHRIHSGMVSRASQCFMRYIFNSVGSIISRGGICTFVCACLRGIFHLGMWLAIGRAFYMSVRCLVIIF